MESKVKMGRPKKGQKGATESRGVVLPVEDLRKIEALATIKGVSVNEIIRQAISSFCEKVRLTY